MYEEPAMAGVIPMLYVQRSDWPGEILTEPELDSPPAPVFVNTGEAEAKKLPRSDVLSKCITVVCALTLLKKAKDSIEAAYVCGTTPMQVVGFRPQSFSQNNDTFKILESLGFQYDAGFKAGVLYLPDHKKDTWPYPIENYSIYAVPVSTYNISGEAVYLSDRYVKEDKGLIVIFNNLISGSGDYFGAYKDFIDYATSKNARFVTTLELVKITIAENANEKLPALAGVKPSACPTCGQKMEGASNLTIGVNVTHKENCTNCNKSSLNATNPK